MRLCHICYEASILVYSPIQFAPFKSIWTLLHSLHARLVDISDREQSKITLSLNTVGVMMKLLLCVFASLLYMVCAVDYWTDGSGSDDQVELSGML